ncbi:MAG: EpsG family protein [Clostridia bacterium]|nr:EpsG family protein [Clostridia bacterium]
MTIFWILLFASTSVAYASGHFCVRRIKTSPGDIQEPSARPNPYLFAGAAGLLIFFSGMRSSIGDTGNYMYFYKNHIDDIKSAFTDPRWVFNIYQFLIKKVFPHPQALLFISALITIGLIFIVLYKYSDMPYMSVFLFIAGGYYLTSMNALRQYLVAAVLFCTIDMIARKKWLPFFVLVIFISLFHVSALIMIPAYFFVRTRAWSPKAWAVLVAGVALAAGFFLYYDFFARIAIMAKQGEFLNTFAQDEFSGANVLRVLVAAVPLALSFAFRKRLRERMKNFDIYTNFSMLYFIVMLFSLHNWLFARFGMYFGLFNLLLLPGIIRHSFNKEMRLAVGYAMVACFMAYMFFELQPHVYASYFLNINPELIGPMTRGTY